MKLPISTISPRSLQLAAVLLCVTYLLGGCGSQNRVSGQPAVPEDQVRTVEAAVEFPPLSNLARDTVQVPYSNIKLRSTVVISHGDLGLGKGEQADANRLALSVAKEEMHKELLRRGFRILDSFQVEARLKELAISDNCVNRQLWWRCTTQLASDEVAYLDGLKARSEQGKIQPGQFAGEVQKYRALWENRVTSLEALLNAVKAGKIAVDYVFDIRAFAPQKAVTRTLNISNVEEIRRFLGENPEIRDQLTSKQYLRCGGIGAEMKARLVNTQNSEVVWLGSYVASQFSQQENGFVVQVGVRKSVANTDEVLQAMDDGKSVFGRRQSADDIPEWNYTSELVGPTLLQGNCDMKPRDPAILQMTTNELAGQVARDLVGTIKISGQVIPAAPSLPESGGISTNDANDKNRFLKDSIGPIMTN